MTTSPGTLVLWARHGQNQANLTRQFSHRRLDLDLTAVGWQQAEQLATVLATRLRRSTEPLALFSSPLRRAQQTAGAVARRLGAQAMLLEGLRELNVGDLDGRNDPEAWAIYRSVLTDWRNGKHDRRFPGGEDWHELRSRLGASLGQIANKTRGGTAVVIAHGANLRAALPGLANIPDPGNDLDTGQVADLRVTQFDTDLHVNLLAWRATSI